jgi:hypothetical protein
VIPKPLIFGVFLDRDEFEIADPRRLRRIVKSTMAAADYNCV